MKSRRVFTQEELTKIEAWGAIRCPVEYMASLLGISKDTMERILAQDDKVRAAFEGGRAKASSNFRQTLYQRAMGHEGYTIPERKDPKTGKIYPAQVVPAQPPDFQAMKFWAQTQEGFKTHDVLEIAGDSSAKEKMTDEELDKRTTAALARIAARRNAK